MVMSDGDGEADLVDVLLAPCLHLGEGHHVEEEPVQCRGRRLCAGHEQVDDHTPHVSGCTQSIKNYIHTHTSARARALASVRVSHGLCVRGGEGERKGEGKRSERER